MSSHPAREIEVVTGADSYRSRTEDRVHVFDHPAGRVIVVADGVGGRSGGAPAADGVVRGVADALARVADAADADAWADVLADADRRIAADPVAGETTAVVAGVTPAGVGGASVGDSGAWLFVDDTYRDLTRIQHRKPYLGSGMALPIPFRHPWPAGGILLVATDGLLKYASPNAIGDAARSSRFEPGLATLVDLVRLTSGTLQDDVAVALCRIR